MALFGFYRKLSGMVLTKDLYELHSTSRWLRHLSSTYVQMTTAEGQSVQLQDVNFPSMSDHVDIPRMSALFIPNLDSLPSTGNTDDKSKNFRLLVSNGFIYPSQRGMFHYLPLGLRVLNKLSKVIINEMQLIGCQELLLSTVTHSRLWKQSGRWEDAGPELFRLKDRRQQEYCLAPTFEENITSLIGDLRRNISPSLPLKLFQISTKYRDEMRSINGLLRGREFIMKDMYSFDRDVQSAEETYHAVISAYKQIFKKLELNAVMIQGSPGKIGGKFSHEFQLPSSAGEDEIFVCNNCNGGTNVELVQCDVTWSCGCDKPSIQKVTSIELGHTFLLGTKYSEPFDASYINQNGKQTLIEMGCYGIGISRLIGACAETSEPATGSQVELVWPHAIAPYSIAVVIPKAGSKEETPDVLKSAYSLAKLLGKPSLFPNDVIIDDRTNWTIGKRVRDLRRLGIPYILVVGGKFKNQGLYELIEVKVNQAHFLTEKELLLKLQYIQSVEHVQTAGQ